MKPPVDAPASRARAPRHATRERVERGRELVAAARHEPGPVAGELDRLVGVDEAGGAGAGLPADAHPPGGDRLDRLAAAPEQPAAHELGVESPALRSPAQSIRVEAQARGPR